MHTRIVLAYSGGLAGSVAIPWLAERHGAEIITVTLDLGDGTELDEVRARALTLGAVRAHVLDVREEFARDYVLPAVRSGALEGGARSLAALAAPLIARTVAEIAAIERAEAIVDGAAACGMTVAEQQEYARARGIVSSNAAARRRARSASLPPDTAARVEISFVSGVPTGINAIAMRLPELLECLTTIAAEHAVGSREDAYGPAAAVLRAAYTHGGASGSTGTVRVKLFNGTCELEGATLAQV
jgi:argininosuccinate synthase